MEFHADELNITRSSSRFRYTLSVATFTARSSWSEYRFFSSGGWGSLAMALPRARSAASRYFSIKNDDV